MAAIKGFKAVKGKPVPQEEQRVHAAVPDTGGAIEGGGAVIAAGTANYGAAKVVTLSDEDKAELGIPFALNMYSIFAVPTGTPDDIVKKLSDAIVAAAKDPGFQELANKLDIVAIPLDSAKATEMVDRQIKQVTETKALMDE